MKFFNCKHWWEVIYKPIVFLLTFFIFLTLLCNIFNIKTDGMGYYGIYSTYAVILYCLVSYIGNIVKFVKKR